MLKVGLITIYCEQIFYIAQSTVPSSHDVPLTVDLSNSEPICTCTPLNPLFVLTNVHEVDASVVFWSSGAFVGEHVAFQLSLTAPGDVSISALPFSSLAIYFSHNEEPVIVHHNADAVDGTKIQRVDLGNLPLEIATTAQGYLRWEKAATIVFVGNVSSDVPVTLAVCSHPSVVAFPTSDLTV